MIYILLIAAIAVAIYFCARFFSLKRTINTTNSELKKIVENIEENRIIKLAAPDEEAEKLLLTINNTLELIRQKSISYKLREKEFKKEIENISHDLRTPLTSVLGYLKIIDSEKLSEEERESLETAKRKAYSLQRLITQFYDLSRISGGEYKLRLEDVDISRLLRESIMEHYAYLSEKNLHISISILDKPVRAVVDTNATERIFTNLLQNAGKYAKTTLNIHLKTHSEHVLIIFENDTDTIEEKYIDRMFDRFYTSDDARSTGSTGLGLTISKHLAECMGGKMSAEIESTKDNQWLKITLSLQN